MKKNLDWLKSKPFAHRGLHLGAECPENSLSAFKNAINNEIPIELDVHVVASGEVVVFHDDNLYRMTGISAAIEEQEWKDIKKLRLLNSNECIPTLQQALECIGEKVPVLVEIKNKKNIQGIEQPILNSLKKYNGPLGIQSFNPITLYWFKKNAPEIIRGQLSGDFRDENMNFIKKIILRTMLLNWLSKPDFISYDIRALPVWAAKVLRKTLPVILWTIKTNDEISKAMKIGDNYIFELENGNVP